MAAAVIAFYNEIDRYCCDWLSNLMDAGLITPGKIDDRSIADLGPDDVAGFRRVHFFAGFGGWEYAARLAGWPDERPIWTGSSPCQPFSVAGKGAGVHDKRHLWPDFFRLIRECGPATVMGEQVAGAAGYGWLNGVCADLEGEAYRVESADIPACAMDAPHIRSRIYWVASREALDHAASARRDGALPGAKGEARYEARLCLSGEGGGQLGGIGVDPQARFGHCGTFWSDAEWLVGADGKARRVPRKSESEVCSVASRLSAGMDGLRSDTIPLLVQGEPARVGKLRALGNAIVPQLAAEVIRAFMEAYP